jgi:TatA/E family protein of Tat protein translocase
MEGFGIEKLLLVLFIVLILFGSKRIPELAGGMGRGIRDFKRALNGVGEDDQNANTLAQQNAALQQQLAAAQAAGTLPPAAPAAPAQAVETPAAAGEPRRLG